MHVLEGRALAEAIFDLFDAPGKLRCAVAFWGPAMAKRALDRGADVVLDISMRGTSRNALTALGLSRDGLPAPHSKVTVLDGLHAKIYIGRQRAIVASANASLNALGDESGRMPALDETGVLIDRDEDAEGYARIKAIYKGYRKRSRAILPEDFDRAVSASWNLAARDNDPAGDRASPSILQAVLHRPEAFTRTAFIFGDNDISHDDWTTAEGEFETHVGKRAADLGLTHICTIAPDWTAADAVLRDARQIVTLWLGKTPGLHACDDVMPIPHGNGDISFYGRKNWPRVRNALGMLRSTKDAVWQADKQQVTWLTDRDGQPDKERFVVLAADRLAEILERG